MKNESNYAVVIFGEEGSGKTINSEKVKEIFNCDVIIEEWNEETPITKGAVHFLTSSQPKNKIDGVSYIHINWIKENE